MAKSYFLLCWRNSFPLECGNDLQSNHNDLRLIDSHLHRETKRWQAQSGRHKFNLILDTKDYCNLKWFHVLLRFNCVLCVGVQVDDCMSKVIKTSADSIRREATGEVHTSMDIEKSETNNQLHKAFHHRQQTPNFEHSVDKREEKSLSSIC